MRWTLASPTEPGWHWIMTVRKNVRPVMVIRMADNGEIVCIHPDKGGFAVPFTAKSWAGCWFSDGPIALPDPPEEK